MHATAEGCEIKKTSYSSHLYASVLIEQSVIFFSCEGKRCQKKNLVPLSQPHINSVQCFSWHRKMWREHDDFQHQPYCGHYLIGHVCLSGLARADDQSHAISRHHVGVTSLIWWTLYLFGLALYNCYSGRNISASPARHPHVRWTIAQQPNKVTNMSRGGSGTRLFMSPRLTDIGYYWPKPTRSATTTI